MSLRITYVRLLFTACRDEGDERLFCFLIIKYQVYYIHCDIILHLSISIRRLVVFRIVTYRSLRMSEATRQAPVNLEDRAHRYLCPLSEMGKQGGGPCSYYLLVIGGNETRPQESLQ